MLVILRGGISEFLFILLWRFFFLLRWKSEAKLPFFIHAGFRGSFLEWFRYFRHFKLEGMFTAGAAERRKGVRDDVIGDLILRLALWALNDHRRSFLGGKNKRE